MTAMCGAEASHRDAILIFYEDVLLKGRLDLLHRLVARSYVPHVPRFARGLAPAAGCEALLQRLCAWGPLPNEVKRIICDGDFVLTMSSIPGPGPLPGAMGSSSMKRAVSAPIGTCANRLAAPPEISMNGSPQHRPRRRRRR